MNEQKQNNWHDVHFTLTAIYDIPKKHENYMFDLLRKDIRSKHDKLQDFLLTGIGIDFEKTSGIFDCFVSVQINAFYKIEATSKFHARDLCRDILKRKMPSMNVELSSQFSISVTDIIRE